MTPFLKRGVSNWIVQGDLNFHEEAETEIAIKRGFKDAWLEKYDLAENPGFTFDAKFNSLINELYWGFEKRRMRLDRIMIKGQQLTVKNINIVMDSPVFEQKKEA